MKKLIKYLLFVIVGLAICDFAISFVIEQLVKNRYNTTVYSTYNTQPDIAIFGASRASHHYVPSVLNDSLSMSAHNYGIDGHNIYTHYLLYEMLLENSPKKPQIVILELSAIDVNNTPKWNEEKLNAFYPYYYTVKSLRSLLADVLDSKELFAIKTFGLYRHNTSIPDYLKRLVTGFPEDVSDGYKPLYKTWKEPMKFEEEHGKTLDPKKISYIEKIIELSNNNGVMLIFAVSPNYKQLPRTQNWLEEVKRISANNNIPLLYHEKDSMFLSHREWFNEPFHLNDEGAHLYSGIIASEIKELMSNISKKYVSECN